MFKNGCISPRGPNGNICSLSHAVSLSDRAAKNKNEFLSQHSSALRLTLRGCAFERTRCAERSILFGTPCAQSRARKKIPSFER
jgi:hypothetical protein